MKEVDLKGTKEVSGKVNVINICCLHIGNFPRIDTMLYFLKMIFSMKARHLKSQVFQILVR